MVVYELKWEDKKGKLVVSYDGLASVAVEISPLAILELAAKATDNTVDDAMVEMLKKALA